MIDVLVGVLGVAAIYITLIIVYFKLTSQKFEINIKLILFVLGGAILSFCLSNVSNGTLTNLLTIIYLYFAIGSISEESKKNKIFYSLIIWLYGIVTDLLIMLIISITKLTPLLLSLNMIYTKTISTFVMIILILSLSSIPFIKKATVKLVKKMQKIKLAIFIDVVIVAMLIYLSILCASDISDISKTTLYMLFAIIILLVFYLALDKYYSIKRLKELNDLLIQNNEFFIKVDNDYRILKHNLTNQLLGIKSVSNDKARKLIDDLIIKYNAGFIASADIYKIPKGINGMIYEKFYNCNNKTLNLSVNNNIKTNIINNVKLKTFNDLCESIGVLLDNALEATKISKEKVVLINFDETETSYIIEINNTFNNELDIDSLGAKDYSTKQRKSGIGLFSILNKKNIIIKNSIKNSIYQTKLIIKKSI